jgi:hypothetical protein
MLNLFWLKDPIVLVRALADVGVAFCVSSAKVSAQIYPETISLAPLYVSFGHVIANLTLFYYQTISFGIIVGKAELLYLGLSVVEAIWLILTLHDGIAVGTHRQPSMKIQGTVCHLVTTSNSQVSQRKILLPLELRRLLQ